MSTASADVRMQPYEVAPETFVIPWVLEAPPVGCFPMNSGRRTPGDKLLPGARLDIKKNAPKSASLQRRIQDRSADSPVRAFLASNQVGADKAVRAPFSALLESTLAIAVAKGGCESAGFASGSQTLSKPESKNVRSDKGCDKVSGKGRLKWDLSAFNMSKLHPQTGKAALYVAHAFQPPDGGTVKMGPIARSRRK